MTQLYKDILYTLEYSIIINAARNTQNTGAAILTSNILGTKWYLGILT
jgi:hypothetical protein